MKRIEVNMATGETVEHDDYFPEPSTEPRVIPQSVSRKQFYMHAAYVEMCTKEEALAALTVGSLPSSLQGIVDGMSNEAAKWEAKMQLLGSNDFHRDSPWVLVIAAVLQWSDDQVDEFWIDANAL